MRKSTGTGRRLCALAVDMPAIMMTGGRAVVVLADNPVSS